MHHGNLTGNRRRGLATLNSLLFPQSEARLGNYQAGFFLGSRCAWWRTVTKRRQLRLAHILNFITALAALAAIAYSFVAYRQWQDANVDKTVARAYLGFNFA